MASALTTPGVQAQTPYRNIGQQYISDFGMTLEQVCINGGPMYQAMLNRLRTINFYQNLKTQTIPVISKQEIQAFEREHSRIKQLYQHYSNWASMLSYADDGGNIKIALLNWCRSLSSQDSLYTQLSWYLRRVCNERPDAIQE